MGKFMQPATRLVRAIFYGYLGLVLVSVVSNACLVKPPSGAPFSQCKEVSNLIKDLQKCDKEERPAIALELATLGVNAIDAVPLLISRMRDCTDYDRMVMAYAIIVIDHDQAFKLLPLFEKVLVSSDDLERRKAVTYLTRLKHHAKPFSKRLVKELTHKDKEFREEVSEALMQIGVTGECAVPLCEMLKNADWKTRYYAAYHLQQCRSESTTISKNLSKALRDTNLCVRAAVARTMLALDPTHVQAKQVAIRLLEHQNWQIRTMAAQAVLEADAHNWDAIKALGKGLKETDTSLREQTVTLLAQASKVEKDAVVMLAKGLRDPNSSVRNAAAYLLGTLARKGKTAVPCLVDSLQDANYSTRENAARALGKIGQGGKAIVSSLTKAMEQNESTAAAAALVSIDSENKDAISFLCDKLDLFGESHTIEVLTEIGSHKALPHAIIKKLCNLFEAKPGRKVKKMIIGIFGNLKPNTKSVQPLLIKALKETDIDVVCAAVVATVQHPPLSKEAIRLLRRCLQHPNYKARLTTTIAIGKMKKIDHHLILDIAKRLVDPCPSVQEQAAIALGKLGRDNKEALPDLMKALHSKNKRVSQAAARALAGQ
jgi:HEAT repeat protein